MADAPLHDRRRKRRVERTREAKSQLRRKSWINKLIKGEISQAMIKQFEHREQMLDEAAKLLGRANDLYIKGPSGMSEAVTLLRKSISLNPCFEAFSLLSSIYDMKGDDRSRRKATELLMLAAHLSKSDPELWKRVHSRYLEQGHIDEGCYCLKRAAAALARTHPDEAGQLLRKKVNLHLEHGHHRSKSISSLKALVQLDLTDKAMHEDALLLLAELYHKHCQDTKAVALLSAHLEAFTPGEAYPTRIALMVCEIQMERTFFREALDLISETVTRIFRCTILDLPPDFLSKAIICELFLDMRQQAEQHTKFMFEKWPVGPGVPYAESYYDVAKAYCDVGEYDMAHSTFQKLLSNETFVQPNIRYHLGRCCQHLNQLSTAINYFESVLEEMPEHAGCRIALSKVIRDLDPDRAIDLLKNSPEEKMTNLDAIRICVELSRLLFYLGQHRDIFAGAGPVLEALLRSPPPPTAITARTARTELSMRSTMSRLISSQFVLSRYDVLPETAVKETDVLSQSALSSASAASVFTSRPALDTAPTLFGRKAKGGTGARKRVHDGTFVEAETASQGTQHTSLADLDGFDDVSEADTASEGGESSGVDSDMLSDMELGELSEMPSVDTSYIRELNRARWHWGLVSQVLPEDSLLEWLHMVLQGMAEAEHYKEAVSLLREIISAIPNSDRFKGMQTVATTQMRRLLVGFSFLLGEFNDAYEVIRGMLLNRRDSSALWNVFAHILHKAEHMRSSHPIMHRILKASPHLFPVLLFVAHFHLCAGSFADATRHYMEAFRRCPDDPLVLLCIAVALLAQVMSRKAPNRHAFVGHAFAFFERYAKARGPDSQQEVHYNVGRAFHHLGLFYLAVPHYWQVLDLAGTTADCGLQREAAFNLHHIYRQSGSTALAAQVLRDHCSV